MNKDFQPDNAWLAPVADEVGSATHVNLQPDNVKIPYSIRFEPGRSNASSPSTEVENHGQKGG